MSDLECNHCGGIAFTSRDYRDGTCWFTDGDGERCDDCGYPGHVSVYEPDPDDAEVSWTTHDGNDDTCNRHDCEECVEVRAAFGLPAVLHSSETK